MLLNSDRNLNTMGFIIFFFYICICVELIYFTDAIFDIYIFISYLAIPLLGVHLNITYSTRYTIKAVVT